MDHKDPDEPPLSLTQQRLWFLGQLTPGSAADNLQAALIFKGRLDPTRLKQCVSEMIQRSEILRTSFRFIHEQPAARVEAVAVVNIPLIDLCSLAPGQQESEFQRLAAIQARAHFDLSQANLFRLTLFQFQEGENRLLLTAHRMIADEESLRVFARMLASLLDGASAPGPKTQFGDFARQQTNQLRGAASADLITWWKAHLEDLLPMELPADHPRPLVQPDYRETLRFTIPASLVSAFAQAGGSPQTLHLAAFSALLARICAVEDFVVGVETANSRAAGWEDQIGPIANLLPLRLNIPGGLPFAQLMDRVWLALEDTRAHAALPYEKILEALPLERDRSLSPLIQVRYLYADNFPLKKPAPGPALEGESRKLELVAVQVTHRDARFDLTLAVEEGPEGVSACFDYNPSLFDAERIQRMAASYLAILESGATNPDRKLEALEILSAAERQLVLETWNGSGADFEADECIQHLFELQVLKTPQATALSDRGERLTFSELNQRANQLAHVLRQQGVGPEVTVGVCIERSLDLITALLGILKAGGAYVPLDPSYPQARLAFILENSRTQFLVTRTNQLENLPAQNLTVTCLDLIGPELARASRENPAHSVIGSNLACVLYTSGSSGIPKGVSSPHNTVINRFFWMWQNYPFQNEEVFVQKTTLNFVDSIWDIFCPLLQGVAVVILPDETLKDAVQSVKTLAKERISRIVLVPSLLRSLLDTGLDGKLPALRFCITSGEAISLELYQRFRAALPQAVLLNLYGTSEVADATWYDSDWERPFSRVPIGRPISNVQIYLLDQTFRPVPIGVPGELYVAGAGVVRGYHNRPDLTAEKFLPDPFSPEPGARMYRTGDMACWLPDGNLDYLARRDFQVKIRGLRIELSEIEESLKQHPGVQAVVTMARGGSSEEKYLAAYVVPDPAHKPSISELRVFLGKRLPGYMIPARFVFLAQMPLTPNGKVNRLALPAPDEDRPDLDQNFLAPTNLTEETIAMIWCQLLHLKRVGIQDNFFDLGGDSLLAMRLAARIQERLQLEIPLAVFFEFPVIADLALVIDDMLLSELENLSDDELQPGPI